MSPATNTRRERGVHSLFAAQSSEIPLKRDSPDGPADGMHRVTTKHQRTLSPTATSTPGLSTTAAATLSTVPPAADAAADAAAASVPVPAVAASRIATSATTVTSVPAELGMAGRTPFTIATLPAGASASVRAALHEFYTQLVRTHYPDYEVKNDHDLFALGAGLAMAAQGPPITVTLPAAARSTISPAGARAARTTRAIYEELVRTRYPNYAPTNDFQLFALGSDDFSHVHPDQLSAHLAQEWSRFVTLQGHNPDVAMKVINELLEEPAEVTGVKPLPGDPDVIIIPIPGSPYSLRIWPGSLTRREYCLDYVYSDDTNRSLNRPKGYDLAAHVPMGSLPWLALGAQELHSLEYNFGIIPEHIGDGQEKYVLRDGLVCVLTYTEKGHEGEEVRFEVPVRPNPG
ncbi:hypothetical protein C8T65DRAFT_746118 [Cerioporus squamosus]|nr:hypothetical protein C8T65DRAFT_746118 [Cerioporus squamosus]